MFDLRRINLLGEKKKKKPVLRKLKKSYKVSANSRLKETNLVFLRLFLTDAVLQIFFLSFIIQDLQKKLQIYCPPTKLSEKELCKLGNTVFFVVL